MTLACSIVSCKSGGDLKSNVKPTATPNVKFYPAENTVQIKEIRRAAVLPFADYSAQQEPVTYREWGGNIKIVEEIIDQLTSHGISVVIQEDINALLVDNEIIKPLDKEKYLIYGTGVGTPKYELKNYKHSQPIQKTLTKIIDKKNETIKNPRSPVLQGATVGLTRDKIKEIGQILDADILFRGRIIEYGYKDIETNSLSNRGIFPLIGQFLDNIFFGPSKDYDKDDNKNEKRSVVVQIRIYAQDVSTGDMLWTNRTEIEYTPKSKYAYENKHPKVMFDHAVKKGIEDLMGSFFSNTTPRAAAL